MVLISCHVRLNEDSIVDLCMINTKLSQDLPYSIPTIIFQGCQDKFLLFKWLKYRYRYATTGEDRERLCRPTELFKKLFADPESDNQYQY